MAETILVLVDGVDADNAACVWAAANAFPDSQVLVAVAETAVHSRSDASPSEKDLELSLDMQKLHTARIAGLLARVGLRDCVYLGLPPEAPEAGGAVPIVPYWIHADHRDYDVRGDENGLGRKAVAGNFESLQRRLAAAEGPIHVVEGGPFGELARLIADPLILPKLGRCAAQAGFELSERTIHAKMSFNGDVRMRATLQAYLGYPGEMFFVPSDLTRHPDLRFASYKELQDLGVYPEIAEMCNVHIEKAEGRQAGFAFHDVQAVLALRYALGREDPGLFTFSRMDTIRVLMNMVKTSWLYQQQGFPRAVTLPTLLDEGYEGNEMTTNGEVPPRYMAVAQNGPLCKGRIVDLVGPPAGR